MCMASLPYLLSPFSPKGSNYWDLVFARFLENKTIPKQISKVCAEQNAFTPSAANSFSKD